MEKQELVDQILRDEHPQFVLNKEKEQVECRCGWVAIWNRTGYLCGTITAYPCEYSKASTQKKKSDVNIKKDTITQFRYSQSEEWQDLPEDRDEFTFEFLEGYHGRGDTDMAYELSCVLGGDYSHKTLDWLYENYPEYNGMSREQIKEKLENIENMLFMEAKRQFNLHISSGHVEVRESPKL